MKPKVLICMPVYNEGEKTARQLHNLSPNPAYDIELFIIDDGSTDNTIELVKQAIPHGSCPVTIVRNERNRGVGYSAKRGIHYGLHHGFDFIMNTAGNGKDDWRQIPILMKPMVDGTHDYITGSRFLGGGSYDHLPLLRKIMMKTFTMIWNVLMSKRLTDVTNGFRVYSAKLFSDPRIRIDQEWLDRYEFEYYLYYKVLTLGYRTAEVPVSKTYPARTGQKKVRYTKIRPFIDWWKMVRPLVFLKLGIKK